MDKDLQTVDFAGVPCKFSSFGRIRRSRFSDYCRHLFILAVHELLRIEGPSRRQLLKVYCMLVAFVLAVRLSIILPFAN